MAIEHEPGCDRQHTARQRCNQNALFAEQGEIPPNGDAPATVAPAAKRRRTPRDASAEAPPAAAVEEERPQTADAAAEAEALDEIVSIHEEVVAAEHRADPFEGLAREPDVAGQQGVPSGLIIAAAVFGVVTALLIVLLLRGSGSTDEA